MDTTFVALPSFRPVPVLGIMMVLLISPGLAQDAPSKPVALTGSLRADLLPAPQLQLQGMSEAQATPVAGKKSPLRAALFSMVVPGAGQYYSEQYWTAAGFLGAEVALWVVYAAYTSRGDKQTDDFQKFADQHWSVVRYAYWMRTYYAAYYQSNTVMGNPPVDIAEPWNYVNWDALNRSEELVGQTASTGFSHRLPQRPEQQYYELIGKYEQYNPGWDDANVTLSDYLTNISPRFLHYRDMRGHANDLYNIASTATYVLVVNHVFSALHAAWAASRFNKHLEMEAHVVPMYRSSGLVEFVPTASVTLTF